MSPGVLEFVRSIDIARPATEVFAYASDFNRAQDWRTEVVESIMEPVGSMRLGSRLHEVALISGRRIVTDSVVDTYEPGHRFTFVHLSGPMTVSGEMAVETVGTGARLTYTLRVRLSGLWVLLAPVFRRTGPATIDASLRRLAEQLTPGFGQEEARRASRTTSPRPRRDSSRAHPWQRRSSPGTR